MKRKILILYASETGYSQETAERIAREARQRHFNVTLLSMHEYNLQDLPTESFVCFVCSVTGQGEEPKTMKSFWKFLLKKSLPSDSLVGMKFGVFGQGDSSYAKFNFPAKKLYKRLIQLGGTAIVPRGDGDDQHYLGVDGALDPWLEAFWDAALKIFPLPSGLSIIPSTTLPHSTFEIEFVKDPEIAKEEALTAKVLENIRITSPDHFQDVRHFEFEIPQNIKYSAGDIMVIKPRNIKEKVLEVIEHLGWKDIMNDYIQFRVNPLVPGLNELTLDAILPDWLKYPITLISLFENHLDIFGRPRRYFFHLLSFFVSDEMQKEKLVEFASTEGQNDLYTYAHKMKRTTFEVLKDFTSVKIALKYLPDLIPRMRERHFSISSPPTDGKVTLTVAIVDYKTKLVERRVGVCTSWMKTLHVGDEFHFRMEKGTFVLPKDGTPIICIGPGTGVAPMRSLVLEHIKNHPSSNVLLTKAKNCLIFGNRNQDCDYLYEAEWKRLESTDNLVLITAFSRDQEDKVYVQHRMREKASMIWDMINNQNANIYLSGNAKRMPVDVAEALEYIFETEGKMDQKEAQDYLKTLERNKRFQQECWS